MINNLEFDEERKEVANNQINQNNNLNFNVDDIFNNNQVAQPGDKDGPVAFGFPPG